MENLSKAKAIDFNFYFTFVRQIQINNEHTIKFTLYKRPRVGFY